MLFDKVFTLNSRILSFFVQNIRVLLVRIIIFTVSLLKDSVVSFRMTHVHYTSRRSSLLGIRFQAVSTNVIVINSIVVLFACMRLRRRSDNRGLVLIRVLNSVTHNAFLSVSLRGFRYGSFALIETFPTFFPSSQIWSFPFNWFILIFQIRKQKVLFVNIIEV